MRMIFREHLPERGLFLFDCLADNNVVEKTLYSQNSYFLLLQSGNRFFRYQGFFPGKRRQKRKNAGKWRDVLDTPPFLARPHLRRAIKQRIVEIKNNQLVSTIRCLIAR